MRLFLRHIHSGGFGCEYIDRFSARVRAAPAAPDVVPTLRALTFPDDRWWERLTLDPESLDAPWARPRPLRERPSADAFRRALAARCPNDAQWALMRAHAAAPRRTSTMRVLAQQVWDTPKYHSANLVYDLLGKSLAREIGWETDRRGDGSPVWTSIVAEGWRPPGREFEWTMVGALGEALATTRIA